MNRSSQLFTNWVRDRSSIDDRVIGSEQKLFMHAQKRALTIFHEAAQRIPAYQHFLKKNHIKRQQIQSINDYKSVPQTTKENYVNQYPIEQRCWNGSLANMHMISTSSGTTGKATYWPRDLQTELDGASVHELLLKYFFQIDQYKTLFINGYAMGNWIAGTFTQACITDLSWKGYPITVMSPGYNEAAIIDLLTTIAPQFAQTIITGHVPFLKEILESGSKQQIPWQKLRVKVIGTGQAISEPLRSYIHQVLGCNDTAYHCINVYGSADAALMGFESPSTINLRKQCLVDKNLSKTLFKFDRLPSIYQYDPRFTYFEENARDLIITKYSGCPLIRYNILDQGGLFRHSSFSQIVNNSLNAQPHSTSQWQLPFVYLFGRDKFMVKIYGASIYPEQVQHVLDHASLQPIITGRSITDVITDPKQNSKLICRIELKKGVHSNLIIKKNIKHLFIRELSQINSNYHHVLIHNGTKAEPKIILYPHGNSTYFPLGVIKKTA